MRGVPALLGEQKNSHWLLVLDRANADVTMHMQLHAGDGRRVPFGLLSVRLRERPWSHCATPLCPELVQEEDQIRVAT